jgi:hypothetical protein
MWGDVTTIVSFNINKYIALINVTF